MSNLVSLAPCEDFPVEQRCRRMLSTSKPSRANWQRHASQSLHCHARKAQPNLPIAVEAATVHRSRGCCHEGTLGTCEDSHHVALNVMQGDFLREQQLLLLALRHIPLGD